VDLLVQVETEQLTVPEDGYVLVTGKIGQSQQLGKLSQTGAEFSGGDEVLVMR